MSDHINRTCIIAAFLAVNVQYSTVVDLMVSLQNSDYNHSLKFQSTVHYFRVVITYSCTSHAHADSQVVRLMNGVAVTSVQEAGVVGGPVIKR